MVADFDLLEVETVGRESDRTARRDHNSDSQFFPLYGRVFRVLSPVSFPFPLFVFTGT